MKFNTRSATFLGCILLKCVLEYGYVKGISEIFGYSGIEIELDFIRILLSWVIALIVFGISCYAIHHTYLWVTNMLFVLLSYTPTMALWGIKTKISNGAILATIIYLICMVITCRVFQISTRKVCITNDEVNIDVFLKRHIKVVYLLICIIFIFSILFNREYAGGRFFLSFAKTLDVRLALRETYIPTVPRYLYMISGGCVLPILFSFCLYLKKFLGMILCMVSSILLYAVNGMKTWILIYIVIIAIYILTKNIKDILTIINMIIYGVACVWGIGLIVYKRTGVYIILSYLHRIQTLPAEFHYYYYDFFQNHPLLFLRDSIGRFFAKSPYSQTVSRLIGYHYYSSSTMNCTNGMFSDFYSNFGYFGLLFYPVIIFWVYRILYKALKGTGYFITLSTVFILTIVLYDNTFFTWLLTGGYLCTVIVFNLIKKVR